jgi:hypothetical protein
MGDGRELPDEWGELDFRDKEEVVEAKIIQEAMKKHEEK